MAKNILLEKDGVRKKVPIGFSWTIFFFGFFTLFFRRNYAWGFTALLLSVASFFWVNQIVVLVGSIVFASNFNKFCATKLLEEGWMPVDDYGDGLLRLHKIIK